jgi:hypothetical protein
LADAMVRIWVNQRIVKEGECVGYTCAQEEYTEGFVRLDKPERWRNRMKNQYGTFAMMRRGPRRMNPLPVSGVRVVRDKCGMRMCQNESRDNDKQGYRDCMWGGEVNHAVDAGVAVRS